jgi:hypothetical protein
MVVLLHATLNLPMTLSIELLGSRATVPLLLYWGLLVVAAIVVVVVAGPAHLSRKHKKQEEREEGAEAPGATTPTVPPSAAACLKRCRETKVGWRYRASEKTWYPKTGSSDSVCPPLVP